MLIKKIESLLIIRVAEYMNDTTNIQLIVDLLGMNKLIQEQERFINKEPSSLLNDWLKSSTQTTKLDMLNQIELIIQTNLEHLKETMSKLPIKLSSCEDQDRKSTRLNSSHVAIS